VASYEKGKNVINGAPPTHSPKQTKRILKLARECIVPCNVS